LDYSVISTEKILDYDKLVEAYASNLDVTLRGFRPAEEMLDTWVPDDDPIRSLCNLVEAAQLGGSDAVSVRVSSRTLQTASPGSVKEKLATLGEVVATEEENAVVFAVSNLQQTSVFRSVRLIYQSELRSRFAKLHFKRPLKSHESQIPLRATQDDFLLAWAVQVDRHIITDAVHDGPARGPMPAVLDCLCEILVGLPIQEARDHAIIRLESSLRAAKQSHPISGIVLPQNADPIFRLPLLLVSRLFNDYIHATNYRAGLNCFDPGPRPAWAALSPAQREQRVAAALAAQISALGIQAEDVHIVECKFPYAMTVRFGDRLSIPAKRKLALAIERVVREQCDPRLEVFCEEKKDMSKLRRAIEKDDK
jgi:hypothetical protein